jgi:hypothetical protein
MLRYLLFKNHCFLGKSEWTLIWITVCFTYGIVKPSVITPIGVECEIPK